MKNQEPSKVEKMTRLLSFIFKNGLIQTYHFNGYLIRDGKLCNVRWIENEIDLTTGKYEYIPVTNDDDISDNVLARTEEVYGKYKLEQENQEKIDSYVKELYKQQ